MFIEELIQGVNTDLDKADNSKVIWSYQAANRTPMTASDTFDITSTSGNDVAAGTGAQAVTIIGLDSNGEIQTEAVTQSATWRTSNSFDEFIAAYVSTAGTSLTNEGDIDIKGTGSGTRFGWIPTGSGQTQQAFYPVKNGFSVEIIEIFCEIPYDAMPGNPIVDYKLFIFDGDVKREIRRWRLDSSLNSGRTLNFEEFPIKVLSGETWWIEAATDTDDTTVVVEVKQNLIRN